MGEEPLPSVETDSLSVARATLVFFLPPFVGFSLVFGSSGKCFGICNTQDKRQR